MKTVFTNENGKHCTAVYVVEVPWVADWTWAQRLFTTQGKSSVVFGLWTNQVDLTRFHILINNRKQTTRADVIRAILRATQDHFVPQDLLTRVKVSVVAGVPEQGALDHTGSPRVGTQHTLKREAHAETIAAR